MEEEENERTVCDICLDGEVYEDNDIIYCDNCDVAVHQLCYGVEKVPEGSWFCYVCSSKLNPRETICELCPYVGGAYKHTEKVGKWVHGLCTCWIPEVFEVYPSANNVFVNLSKLDMKRYKLKCTICSSKGACVQCAYGRCTTSVHPWCALKDSNGFTRRIVKNSEGNSVWEIFCSVHAKAVSDPIKIKSKSKSITKDLDDEFKDSYWTDTFSSSVKAKAPTHNTSAGQQAFAISSERDCTTQTTPKSFPIVSLLEWPGINEGDAMDLDHFWNYVSSFYPEDHNTDWLTSMITSMCKIDGLKSLVDLSFLENSDSEIEEKIDYLLSNYLNEKERQGIFLPIKKAALFREVNDILLLLKSNQGTSYDNADLDPLSVDEMEFLVSNGEMLDIRNCMETILANKPTLQVLFNGRERFGCEFKIESDNTIDIGGKEHPQIDWGFQYLYPHSSFYQQSPSSEYAANLCGISHLEPFAESTLSDGSVLIPKINEDELSRLIYGENKALNVLTEVLHGKLSSIQKFYDMFSLSSKTLDVNETAKRVGIHYLHQQIWRKISISFHNGLRDHSIETSPNEDDVPPSWKIAASGRPVPDNDEELEPHEDAVCMCCFDGASSENNRIIFCDGCNCAVHQICYGITEIPEGDYFCDRCRFIQLLSHDSIDELDEYTIKTAVQCCLCPLHHGGLKPTTDGRWAHVYCVMVARNSCIEDLKEISAVDVSKVVISNSALFKMHKSNNSMVCKFCENSGGYIVTCDYVENCNIDNELCCSIMFHPICAWFAGMYFSTEIVDPSFCESNQYPSGIKFQIFCECHSSMKRKDRVFVEDQKTIRCNFKINEKDLELFPGHNRRRRYKSRKKQQSLSSRQTKTLKSSPKELPIDSYSSMCCICLHSTERSLFSDSNNVNNLNCDISSNTFLTRDVERDLIFNDLLKTYSETLSQSEHSSKTVTCRKCNIAVHTKCLNHINQRYDFELNGNECFVCRSTDPAIISCCLCPRRGGLLVETADNKWAHLFCVHNSPVLTRWLPTGELDLKIIAKECKKQKCSICNRKSGVCVQCSSLGCSSFFHSLCGMKSGLAFVRVRGSSREFFCRDHIPSGLAAISPGCWIDGHELHRFRYCFDRARLVLDLIIKREKLKKIIFKTETESVENKYERILHRAKGKRLPVSECDVEDSEFSDSDMESSEIADISLKQAKFVSLESVVSTGTFKFRLFNNNEVEVSSLWSNSAGIKLPKLIASICGIEVSNEDIGREASERNFLNSLHKLIENAVDQTRNATRIFQSKSEEQSFSYTIEQLLTKMLSVSNKEFLNFTANCEALNEMLPLQELEKVQPKRKRKFADQDNANMELPPPKKSPVCDTIDEYDDVMTSELSENEKFFVSQLDRWNFVDCMERMKKKVPDGVLDEWKQYTHAELYKLERLLQDFLNYLAFFSSDDPSFCSKNLKRFSPIDALTKDFDEIPYKIIPNYNQFVRRVICLNDIKQKLHRHEYNCLGAFFHDLFLMLNNARSVTDCNSQTWQDTKVLAESFEQAIIHLEQNPLCKQPRSKPSEFEVIKGSPTPLSNSRKIVCGKCVTKYTARGWPAKFDYNNSQNIPKKKNETIDRSTRNKPGEEVPDSDYIWLCPHCAVNMGDDLIGCRIKIWWIDDSCAYSGVVDAFDEFSKCHRVLYDDSEWEFINLCVEPFLLKYHK